MSAFCFKKEQESKAMIVLIANDIIYLYVVQLGVANLMHQSYRGVSPLADEPCTDQES